MKFNCLFCNKVGSYNPKQAFGKYCDNTCRQALEWLNRKEEIRKTGLFPNEYIAKKYLLEQGRFCKSCLRVTWMGKPIPLVLDHIDGKHDNRKVKNFRLICANCDAQTPTYKSKNNGNGRNWRRSRYAEGKTF
jgi:hypothetical protein